MRRGAERAIALAFAFCAPLPLAGLGGCVPWPGYATGGLAERHPTESPEIVLLESRYEALAEAGAMQSSAARMTETNLMLMRARREFAAGLVEDAQHSAMQVDAMLAVMERDIRPGRPRARSRAGS